MTAHKMYTLRTHVEMQCSFITPPMKIRPPWRLLVALAAIGSFNVFGIHGSFGHFGGN